MSIKLQLVYTIKRKKSTNGENNERLSHWRVSDLLWFLVIASWWEGQRGAEKMVCFWANMLSVDSMCIRSSWPTIGLSKLEVLGPVHWRCIGELVAEWAWSSRSIGRLEVEGHFSIVSKCWWAGGPERWAFSTMEALVDWKPGKSVMWALWRH